MRHCNLIIIAIFAISTQLIGQTRVTNYKTGIDFVFSGERGTTFDYEDQYYDQKIFDRKIIYIRSSTEISLVHNNRNIAAFNGYEVIGENGKDGISGTGDEGVIRYRMDGDYNFANRWSGATANPEFSGSKTFATLNYPNGDPVLGSLGPKAGAAITDQTSYYYRGFTDSYGSEWHTMQIADDDTAFATADSEWHASDGKWVLFVVNPKTPCLRISAANGAQFYTTPAKAYFVPKIHEQSTYIYTKGGGRVTFTVSAINGSAVSYRINGGAWVTSSTPLASFDDTLLPDGQNILEYKYASGAIKTRKVVKNPAFPSASERHGYSLWVNDDRFNEIKTRLSRSPYANAWKYVQTNDTWNSQSKILANCGTGLRYKHSGTLANAFAAKVLGISANGQKGNYALLSKNALLENWRTIDAVGVELPHSGTTLPSREVVYRGYYDVDGIFDAAFAYDLLISCYKSTDAANGITPVEDYYIRDTLASFVIEQLMNGSTDSAVNDTGGMWDTARRIGAMACMVVMPSYTTDYYGTSGLDGNTTAKPYTPFPDFPITWSRLLWENNAEILGYPNNRKHLGIEEYNISADGNFIDRAPYFDFHLMGHCFYIADNLHAMAGKLSFPNLRKAMLKASEGSLMGLKDNSGPSRFNTFTAINNYHPQIAVPAINWLQTIASTDSQSVGKMQLKAGIFGFVWYDDTANTYQGVDSAVVSVQVGN